MRSSKIFSIINALLYIGVVSVNALANIIPINNYNTGELSDLIPNLFVPAGITFSIWGVIYILLALLVIFNIIESFRNSKFNFSKINILLGINFILNISWILAWHYRLILLSLFIMFGIFFTLFLLDSEYTYLHKSKFKNIYFISIGVYFGWISVASIANITAFLVTLGWNGYPFTDVTWTIIVILIGSLIAVFTLIKSKNIPYSLVFIWAYVGILIKRNNSLPVYNSIIVVTYISIILIILTLLYTIIKSTKSGGK